MWHDTYHTSLDGQDVRVDRIINSPEEDHEWFYVEFPDGSAFRLELLRVEGSTGWATGEERERDAARFYRDLLERLIENAGESSVDADLRADGEGEIVGPAPPRHGVLVVGGETE